MDVVNQRRLESRLGFRFKRNERLLVAFCRFQVPRAQEQIRGVIFTTPDYFMCKAVQLWVAVFALGAAVVFIRDVLLRCEINASCLCFFFFFHSSRTIKGPVWQFRRKKTKHTGFCCPTTKDKSRSQPHPVPQTLRQAFSRRTSMQNLYNLEGPI